MDDERQHASLAPWRGTPPDPREEVGIAVFERSRSMVEETLMHMMAEKKSKAEETILPGKVLLARGGIKSAP